MSRPGRFALRVLAVTAVLFALMAPASFGQTVSLSGETFETVPALGQQTTFGPFTCNKSRHDRHPVRDAGIRVRTLLRHLHRDRNRHHRTADRSDLRLARHRRDPRFPGELHDHEPVPDRHRDRYQAARAQQRPAEDPGRTRPLRSRRLIGAGQRPVRVRQQPVPCVRRPDQRGHRVTYRQRHERSLTQSLTNLGSPTTFQEAFTSTDSVPPECEDGNNGNGVGGGHPKKNNDNDDDEHCQ